MLYIVGYMVVGFGNFFNGLWGMGDIFGKGMNSTGEIKCYIYTVKFD